MVCSADMNMSRSIPSGVFGALPDLQNLVLNDNLVSSLRLHHCMQLLDVLSPQLFSTKDHSSFQGRNDIVVSDLQCLNITRPYWDAQNKPAWRDKTCATHT